MMRDAQGPVVPISDHAPPALSAETLVLTIDGAANRRFTATSADGSVLDMRQAVSCLVTPAPGDRVLAALSSGEAFILAILERPSGSEVAGLRIETDGGLDFVARRITFRAGFVDVLGDTINMMGDAFNSLFRRSKRIVGSDTVIAKSTTLRTGERVSVIAQADVQHAGVFSQTVDGPAAINAHTAVLTAKSDIRLNGERINVG